jgi:hypothetical protein
VDYPVLATTLEHLKPIVASINTLIGNCENMEATYCVGSDVDVCRMFDQYLYKVPILYLIPLYIYSILFNFSPTHCFFATPSPGVRGSVAVVQ